MTDTDTDRPTPARDLTVVEAVSKIKVIHVAILTLLIVVVAVGTYFGAFYKPGMNADQKRIYRNCLVGSKAAADFAADVYGVDSQWSKADVARCKRDALD